MERAEIEALYLKYGPAVLRRARSILGDEASARDAMQEVFIRVMRSLNEFRSEASPMTWLYRITTNLCLNQLRDGARRAELLAQHHAGHSDGATPRHEGRLTAARMLARLPDELQEIAVYYYVDEMNQDEIAALLGLSRRTIGNRLETFRELAGTLAGAQEVA